jgi:hypothetical protein
MENTSVAIQLTPFEAKKEELISLASDYKNMVVTKENLKEANEARLVLYRKRIEIQNVAKANRKTIKDFLKSNNDAIETELIETIEPTEIALEGKIKQVKDAIELEGQKEAARVAKHKQWLDVIRAKTVEVTNSNDIEWLKTWFEEDEPLDLEEFTAEGEQLLATIKETAKNRLELLEFQAKKKAEQDAYEIKIAATLLANTANNIDSAILEGISGAPFDESVIAPKLSPLKTVPIGVVSEQNEVSDKELLERLANQIISVGYPNCESKEAKQHVEYIKNMLSKLSEQTLKVAEKL